MRFQARLLSISHAAILRVRLGVCMNTLYTKGSNGEGSVILVLQPWLCLYNASPHQTKETGFPSTELRFVKLSYTIILFYSDFSLSKKIGARKFTDSISLYSLARQNVARRV